uniref:CMP/dCMP-type deaminase domain-containing protein n=1 Tax=viral metagenome TaxID=1070528 RepID=A0A6C0J759_9ZZZZ
MSKRTDYISWPEYFIELAKLTAKRSKDPSTQVGACIIDNKNRIVGVGYNGFPRGCSDNEYSWNRTGEENKYMYVIHAEINAIHNKINMELDGCTLYVTHHPCNECSKSIIQAGIKNVVYLNELSSDYNKSIAATKKMFKSSDVTLTKYTE